jgi:hypothetical protein
MSYIGNTATTQAFTPAIDYFNGNGSTTAFTLSKPVASVAQIQVHVNNVAQNPASAYSVSSNTITFTSAPSSGTNNIYVYYTSPITQVIQPGQNTVYPSSLSTTNALYWDTSGNVGIGTATPSGRLNLAVGASTSCTMRFTANNTGTGAGDRGRLDFYSADNSGVAYQLGYMDYDRSDGTGTASYIAWANRKAGTVSESMRIDSSGALLINSTSNFGLSGVFAVKNASGPIASFSCQNSATAIGFGNQSGTATYNAIYFYTNAFGTNVGSIAVNSGSTAYNTTSDYRLKENIQPMTGALARVQTLKPVTYTWKADGSDAEGFIAHELAEVCPHAVTGEKDAVDDKGDPKYQQVDVSFLVATLTAAIQEQQALITALTARIEALEKK